MKKVLFIILLITNLTGNGYSQYIPTLVDGSEWFMTNTLEEGDSYNFVMELDSTVNGQRYWTFYREDTLEQKVYMDEVVILDYSLKPGDIFQTANSVSLKLDSISLFFTSDADGWECETNFKEARRFFYFTETGSFQIPYREIWIEGIGAYNGLGSIGDDLLICHFDEEGIKDFSIQGYVNCKASGNVDINNNYVDIKLSPNPSNTSIQLEFEGITDKSTVLIYDILGIKQKQISLSSFDSTISVKDLVQGVYFLHILKEGKLIGVTKFVVN